MSGKRKSKHKAAKKVDAGTDGGTVKKKVKREAAAAAAAAAVVVVAATVPAVEESAGVKIVGGGGGRRLRSAAAAAPAALEYRARNFEELLELEISRHVRESGGNFIETGVTINPPQCPDWFVYFDTSTESEAETIRSILRASKFSAIFNGGGIHVQKSKRSPPVKKAPKREAGKFNETGITVDRRLFPDWFVYFDTSTESDALHFACDAGGVRVQRNPRSPPVKK